MLDENFLNKKLQLLTGYIDEMEPIITGFSLKELKDDSLKYHTTERLFQLIVDIMIDINIYIIRQGDFGPPDDLQSTFKTLGEHAVLNRDFAEKIAPIVGARNMIVHRYDKLDMDLFLRNLKENFSDFKKYMVQIYAYLKNHKK
ncbi:MAG: DUF86 domain-containing protein [Candidatus Taylorbacteria bacterium]|nr:DUF86 domain-containing protein [Candidatus Taylorbacteria bacterium]